jgi:hypothetical protein
LFDNINFYFISNRSVEMSSGIDRQKLLEKLDPDILRAARLLALAVNSSDPEPLIEKLADGVKFETQSSFEVLTGIGEVADSLRTKFAAVKNGGHPPHAEVGVISGGKAGIIIRQEEIVRTFWTPTVDEEGLISSIFGITVAPFPGTATGLGETPGLDQDGFRREEEKRVNRHRKWVQSLDGPIEFVAFLLSGHMKLEREIMLREMTKKFHGSTSRCIVHDFDSEDDTEIYSEARRYDILGYPAIAVNKGGQVIRKARGSNEIHKVLLELENMGIYPSSDDG